jgi:hypothetical protein
VKESKNASKKHKIQACKVLVEKIYAMKSLELTPIPETKQTKKGFLL